MKKNIFCGVLLNVFCIYTSIVQAADIDSAELDLLRTPTVAQQEKGIIDCDYRASAEIDTMDQDTVINWAKYAVTQSFDFNLTSIDTQLSKLRSCYTKNGWDAFLNAFQESGNLKKIKDHNLYMSSQLDGQPELIAANETQWKIVVPIKVLYKNDQETVVHFLSIYLTIGWRNAFNLGITQMIAIPRFAPVSYETVLVKEGIQSIFSGILDKKTDGVEGVKNSVEPFFVSLFTKINRDALPKNRLIASLASFPPSMYSINRQGPQHVEGQPSPKDENKQIQQNQMAYRVLNHHNQLAETATLKNILSVNNSKKSSYDFFDFKPETLTTQLQKAIPYSMEKSMDGLVVSLDKLKHAKVTKTQKLTLKSQKDREPRLVETRDNQWNMMLPVQIVYQNDQDKVTKLLNVALVIERKPNGELGITQMHTMPSDASLSENTAKLSSANEETKIIAHKQQADATQYSQPINTEQQKKEPPIIDCDYKIPGEMSKIDQSVILSWAEHAVMQSFNFSSDSLEEQLQKLHTCYTENGWAEFKNALEKSGNVQTFKTHKLTSSSQMDGVAQIDESRENQWVLTLPLKVVYRFDTANITQLMQVRLIIGRKITGELGIMQLNSTIRPEEPAAAMSHK